MGLVIKTTGLQRRIRDRVQVDENGCWIWQLYIRRDGYGEMSVRTDQGWRNIAAYRVSYVAFRGEIPEGMEPDHRCRVRACVNPDHLEAVTRRVNLERSDVRWARYARTGACDQGHDLTAFRALTPKGRCRECWNAYMREYKRNRKVELAWAS